MDTHAAKAFESSPWKLRHAIPKIADNEGCPATRLSWSAQLAWIVPIQVAETSATALKA